MYFNTHVQLCIAITYTCVHIHIYLVTSKSRLTVVSREAKEEVPCDGLSTNAREYFTRTNLAKTKNTITYEP